MNSTSTKAGIAGLAALGLLAISGLFWVFNAHTIDAGERGVVFHGNGSLSEMGPGRWQFLNPFTNSLTVYDVRSQVDKADASAASEDLQQVDVEVTVQFHPDPSQIMWLHQNVGGDYLGKVIQPAVQEAVKASTAHHTAANIIQERPQVKLEIEGVLQARLSASHIIIDQVSLTNIGFSPQFEKAIEDSQTARQNIVLEQNNLIVMRLRANQTIVQAQAQADSARLLAESTQGQQGATYMFLQWLAKWDGHLPVYMAGADANGFILPSPTGAK